MNDKVPYFPTNGAYLYVTGKDQGQDRDRPTRIRGAPFPEIVPALFGTPRVPTSILSWSFSDMTLCLLSLSSGKIATSMAVLLKV